MCAKNIRFGKSVFSAEQNGKQSGDVPGSPA